MKYLLILAVLALTACQKAPESAKGVNGFKVEKLFDYDGCTVYRFYDDRTVYFTRCDGMKPTTAYTESCGKGCSRLVTN